jgi:8-oxo-dGTP diphosphatase
MAYTYQYPRPMLTVDALVFAQTETERFVLLIKRKNPPFQGQWALPGGFVEMDEDLECAVKRELKEETGLEIDHLEQFYTFGKPGRDPRGRNVTVVFCQILQETRKTFAGDDAEDAKWFPIQLLPELAFDHQEVIEMALSKFFPM